MLAAINKKTFKSYIQILVTWHKYKLFLAHVKSISKVGHSKDLSCLHYVHPRIDEDVMMQPADQEGREDYVCGIFYANIPLAKTQLVTWWNLTAKEVWKFNPAKCQGKRDKFLDHLAVCHSRCSLNMFWMCKRISWGREIEESCI